MSYVCYSNLRFLQYLFRNYANSITVGGLHVLEIFRGKKRKTVSFTPNIEEDKMTATVRWAVAALDLYGPGEHLLLGESTNRRVVIVNGTWDLVDYLVPDQSMTYEANRICWHNDRREAAEAMMRTFLDRCGDPENGRTMSVIAAINRGVGVGWWQDEDKPLIWSRAPHTIEVVGVGLFEVRTRVSCGPGQLIESLSKYGGRLTSRRTGRSYALPPEANIVLPDNSVWLATFRHIVRNDKAPVCLLGVPEIRVIS
jgi:hypothetical protein